MRKIAVDNRLLNGMRLLKARPRAPRGSRSAGSTGRKNYLLSHLAFPHLINAGRSPFFHVARAEWPNTVVVRARRIRRIATCTLARCAAPAPQHARIFLLYSHDRLLTPCTAPGAEQRRMSAPRNANQTARERRRRTRINADAVPPPRRSRARDDRGRCARAASVRPEAACPESAA